MNDEESTINLEELYNKIEEDYNERYGEIDPSTIDELVSIDEINSLLEGLDD